MFDISRPHSYGNPQFYPLRHIRRRAMDTQNKSSFDADAFLQSLTEDATPETVDAAFVNLAAQLPKADYPLAVAAVENLILSPLREEIQTNGAEYARQRLKPDLQSSPADDA